MQHAERSYLQRGLHDYQELDFCLVWAKIDGEPWWPGIVIPQNLCRATKRDYVWIFWNSEKNVSLVEESQVFDFGEFFAMFHRPCLLDDGYLEDNITNIKCHAWQQGNRIQSWSNDEVLIWARNGFTSLTQLFMETSELPPDIMEAVINAGKGLYSVSIQRSGYLAKNDPDERKLVATHIPKKPQWNDRQKQNIVRYKQGSKENICVACMKTTKTCDEHPLFYGMICYECKIRGQKYMFTSKENKLVACAICFWKSDVSCKSTSCLWTFCAQCCSTFIASRSCILCLEEGSNIMLKKRDNSLNKLLHFFSPTVMDTEYIPTQTVHCKKQLRVLSLFDGIGTGLFVLQKELFLPVTKYFASEIDQYAMKISDKNFPDQITYVGDVRQITDNKIKEILADGPIDLLIGASPCNDLSLVNHLRKGLYDMQGTGPLFFHFHNILLKIRLLQPREHVLFYFYENVANLAKETKQTISLFLGHNPTVMDATHFSAQVRRRNFWGNIPGMHTTVQLKEEHKIQDYFHGNPYVRLQKLKTLTKSSEITVDDAGNFLVDGGGKCENLSIEVLERIFGYNRGYTEYEDSNYMKRRHLLSSAWSVPVVSRLMQGLKVFFLSEDNRQQ